MKPILIVDNEEKFCKVVKTALDLENLNSEYETSGEAALEWLAHHETDIVVTDLRMEGMDGLALLERIKQRWPDIEVIMMTAYASQKTAVDALKKGALDYLIKPFELDELVLRIRRIFRQKQILEENRSLKASQREPVYFKEIIGRSARMKEIYNLIQKAADSESTVLIEGESGTGKELVAEVIHAKSSRSGQPFVPINCAAIPENLLESELFGYEKGAFTGAAKRNIGKFEAAGEGTLFLDEIGDLGQAMQAKLLRVLQNKEIYRLGGSERIKIKTRIVAATNRNLEELVRLGNFREDLFYRLNIFPIKIPPLRERKEDLPELVNHFIKQHDVVGIDRNALKLLMDYDWPGNVRELQNVIERSSILADAMITLKDIPPLKKQHSSVYDFRLPEEGFQLDEFEKFLVHQALEKAEGNKTNAAQLLGVTRRRLYSIMNRFGIDY